MAKPRNRKFGLAAGVAGLMAAGAAPSAQAETLKSEDGDCPQAAVGALRTIVGANTDYNSQAKPRAGPAVKKKTAKKAAKKATRKKTAKKTAKKAAKKATKKTARKRALKRPVRKPAPRRDPC